MIISVYFAKDDNEIWDFKGEYEELTELNSDRRLLFSLEETNCPIMILHGPAKEPLRNMCVASNSEDNDIAEELDQLYQYIKSLLDFCNIPNVDKAKIRLFIHFGALSKTTLASVNNKLAHHHRENFQCFSVSRYHGIPQQLYFSNEITPPQTEEAINAMCKMIGRGSDESVNYEHVRSLVVLCQAVATLPKDRRKKYLKGESAYNWWNRLSSFVSNDENNQTAEDSPWKTLIDKIKEQNPNTFDISDVNLGLITEVVAQKLQENQK